MKRLPFVLLLLLAACTNRPQPDAEAPRYRNMDLSVEFVGKEACRGCHPDKYASYVQSEMGRSFKRATFSNSDARWDGAAPVYDAASDLYYQPFRRGEALFVKEYRLSGRDTVHARTERIDYIVGSGQHTNSHMYDVNGYVYQIPMTWYVQKQRWDLPPGFHAGNNTRFDRAIQLECMTCHNARPTYVAGSENRFTHIPNGIDCESCHGPGALHVREKGAGEIVDTSQAPDYSIVNPRRLPVERQFDICQRCHMQGAAVLADDKTFLDFRPGGNLDAFTNVYWPRDADSVRQFIMASHPDRLKMSPCFKATWAREGAAGAMTCITCHDPHVSVKQRGADAYNQPCRTCHTPPRGDVCAEEPAVRARNGDNCFACHMPTSGSSDIPHVQITDHYIRKPDRQAPPEATPALQKFYGMASLINKAPTAKDMADGYLTYYEQFKPKAYYLDSAAVYLERARRQEASRASLPDSWVRLWFLQGDYRAITSYAATASPERLQPWTRYRIGEAFLKQGDAAGAVPWLEAAAAGAPQHLRFKSRLAYAYAGRREPERALALQNEILALNPKFWLAYNDRGYLRALSGDLDAARMDFRQALGLNPDEEQTLANLASLYLNTGRKQEARPHARRLLELAPQNAQYRELWRLVQ